VISLRRILHILLLLCLPMYGFAMQGSMPSVASPASLVHEVEHDQGISHHHHADDGTIHYDDSDASRDHAQDHTSSPQPAGFGLPPLPVAPEQLVSKLVSHVTQWIPEPFLDGPSKPPSPAPGQAAGGTLHA
jgi:hypothetical protein